MTRLANRFLEVGKSQQHQVKSAAAMNAAANIAADYARRGMGVQPSSPPRAAGSDKANGGNKSGDGGHDANVNVDEPAAAEASGAAASRVDAPLTSAGNGGKEGATKEVASEEGVGVTGGEGTGAEADIAGVADDLEIEDLEIDGLPTGGRKRSTMSGTPARKGRHKGRGRGGRITESPKNNKDRRTAEKIKKQKAMHVFLIRR